MSDEAVTVTKKGQVTIPARFRKLMNIHEGSKLLVSQSDNSITMRLLMDLEELAGIHAGKMTLSEARIELDELRKIDRY
ncbi:MAG: AbrB/MazE/SpoVT family DNA-binding domain-containing protein [Thaumarchaeota archaeon]|nr:AbrB/MazE/SpoVT family DNA-binding domain-containing protein [Nitrososphaerota archaeon]